SGRGAGPGAADRSGRSPADPHVRTRGDQPPGRCDPPRDQTGQQRGDQPATHERRHRRQRAAPIREIAGRSLLPAHRRKTGIMIRTIKAEWRKNIMRPALLVGSGIVGGVVALVYAVNFYEATHPSVAPRGAASILTLYPDQLVNNM